ncbi:hypothetical protein T492DRAFT_856576, partial [Pavlovales sp. CCMP2436]
MAAAAAAAAAVAVAAVAVVAAETAAATRLGSSEALLGWQALTRAPNGGLGAPGGPGALALPKSAANSQLPEGGGGGNSPGLLGSAPGLSPPGLLGSAHTQGAHAAK